jgi:hypothetical protein
MTPVLGIGPSTLPLSTTVPVVLVRSRETCSCRHTAATWLRQATGDTRLVAEYLGHADLSTVSRYAHVASEEMHAAVQILADHAALSPTPTYPADDQDPTSRA